MRYIESLAGEELVATETSAGAALYTNELDKAEAFKKLYISLVGFRESLKLNHLSTTSWQQHLATDKAYDEVDDLIDTLGEVYFLPRGISIKSLKIDDEAMNGANPAVLAIAINTWADNLAASVDDNALINYLNGLSQEMQRYVGWLRLGTKDIEQDAINGILESASRSKMRSFVESVLTKEAFGGQKNYCLP